MKDKYKKLEMIIPSIISGILSFVIGILLAKLTN